MLPSIVCSVKKILGPLGLQFPFLSFFKLFFFFEVCKLCFHCLDDTMKKILPKAYREHHTRGSFRRLLPVPLVSFHYHCLFWRNVSCVNFQQCSIETVRNYVLVIGKIQFWITAHFFPKTNLDPCDSFIYWTNGWAGHYLFLFKHYKLIDIYTTVTETSSIAHPYLGGGHRLGYGTM